MLSRRNFLKTGGVAAGGLALSSLGIKLVKAQDSLNPQEYFQSLPLVFRGVNPNYPLLAGDVDWPNIQAIRLSADTARDLDAVSSSLIDYVQLLIDEININSENLVTRFFTIPQYRLGDPTFFTHLAGSQINIRDIADSNLSGYFYGWDFHNYPWAMIPSELFHFDAHESNLYQVLALRDSSRILSLEQLHNRNGTIENEWQLGTRVNMNFFALVDSSSGAPNFLQRLIDYERPQILQVSLGNIDYRHPRSGSFDPGRTYLQAREAIQICIQNDVVPIIILPNILDVYAGRYFIASTKGLALCCLLDLIAQEFNIPLINHYRDLSAIPPRQIADTSYMVGGFGTGLRQSHHYSHAGELLPDAITEVHEDELFEIQNPGAYLAPGFEMVRGLSALQLRQIRFYGKLLEEGYL